MKKSSLYLLGLILISLMVIAPAPPVPMPFVIYATFDGAPVIGLDVKFTCGTNTLIKQTNENGGAMVDVGTGGDFPCTSILAVDCGYTICQQSYNINSIDLPYQVTYPLTEQPQPEPELEAEPEAEEKLTSNEDKTIASLDAYFGQTIELLAKNNKLSKLQDKEIEFDGDDYDIHEEILAKGIIQTSLDDEDFGIEPRLVIKEGEIQYKYVFDDLIDIAKIDDDEELEINLLGEDIKIISAKADEIVIEKGQEFRGIKEGESITYNNKIIKVTIIDQDFVYLEYNGNSKKIIEGDVGELGDLEVLADEVITNEDGDDMADLKVGEEVEINIKDGDDYEEEETFRWIISMPNYIGIENQNDYDDVEDDEGYLPLSEGDKITLPNNFAILKFNEVSTSEETEINIKVKDSKLYARGDRDDSFVYNSEDRNKIYVDSSGIYDEDLISLGTTSIQIGDSDIKLESGSIIIGKLKILQDMSDILYNGISFIAKDQIYLDYEGIIFKDPENAVEEKNGFEVIVPDERPEVTITLGAEPAKLTPEGCEEIICPESEPVSPSVCPENPTVECPETPICPVCPPVEECEKPSNTMMNIIWGLVAIVFAIAGLVLGGYTWYPGFKGLATWRIKEGMKAFEEGNTAEAKKQFDAAFNSLKTATERAKEGKYSG